MNAPFQKRFSVFLATISLILTGIFVVFCYTYLKVTLQELTASNQQIVHKFVRPFVLLILGLGFGFSFLIYILGSLFSHRIAGPIYAFERFLRDTINGKKPGFRMRQSDEFKHLEPLAIEISEKFSSLEAAQLQRDSADKIVSSADPEGK